MSNENEQTEEAPPQRHDTIALYHAIKAFAEEYESRTRSVYYTNTKIYITQHGNTAELRLDGLVLGVGSQPTERDALRQLLDDYLTKALRS